MRIKRILGACMAIGLLLAALPAAAASGWQGAYTELVQRGIAEYNKFSHPEKGGLYYDVLDIDLDGTPELYMVVIQSGQIDSAMTEVAFTIRDGQVVPLRMESAEPIFRARDRDHRNNIFLAEKTATGERFVLVKTTGNEGSYDYSQSFFVVRLDSGNALTMECIAGVSRPDDLEQTDREDTAGRAFFDQEQADMLKPYSLLAEGIGVRYTLQSREQIDGPISEDPQQTLANLSAWRPADGGAPIVQSAPAAPAETDDGWLNLY